MKAFNGHMQEPYGKLPCYTLKHPHDLQTANRGNYTVLPPRSGCNISNELPWDTNWGRSDWIPILPLQPDARELVNDTFQVKLPSDYMNIPYSLRNDEIRSVDFLRLQAVLNRK